MKQIANALFREVVAVIVGLVLICGYFVWDTAIAQGPETATPDGERYVAIGILLWDREVGVEVKVYNGTVAQPTASPVASTQAPTASNTPLPTASPTPTATLTPTDTPTATATASNTPTATPLPSATPTATLAAPTGFPTPTPESGTLSCPATVTATSVVNARADHSTSAALVGKLAPGDALLVYETWSEDKTSQTTYYDWARFIRPRDGLTGWAAFLYTQTGANVQTQTWIDWDREHCGIPHGGPGVDENVATKTAIGFTVTTGANRDELLDAGRILQAAGIQPVATVTCEKDAARVLHANGWWVNYRPCYSTIGDLPVESLPPADSARARVALALWDMGDTPASTIALTNEWVPASPEYANAWIVAAMNECVKRGVRCIPVMFAPGNPDIGWLEAMRPAMRAIKAGNGYLGYNAYSVVNAKLSNLNTFTLWTTFRFRLWGDWLGDDMPPIFISEAAEFNGTAPADVGDMAGFAAAVDGEVAAVCFWYFGHPLSVWQNAVLNGKARHLAGLIAATP